MNTTKLHEACDAGDVTTVEQLLLQSNAHVDSADGLGRTMSAKAAKAAAAASYDARDRVALIRVLLRPISRLKKQLRKSTTALQKAKADMQDLREAKKAANAYIDVLEGGIDDLVLKLLGLTCEELRRNGKSIPNAMRLALEERKTTATKSSKTKPRPKRMTQAKLRATEAEKEALEQQTLELKKQLEVQKSRLEIQIQAKVEAITTAKQYRRRMVLAERRLRAQDAEMKKLSTIVTVCRRQVVEVEVQNAFITNKLKHAVNDKHRSTGTHGDKTSLNAAAAPWLPPDAPQGSQ